MVNQGTLLGRVAKIETNTTSTGVKISKLSMATSKKFVKNGEKQEKTTWHNVTLFSKLAEIAEKYVSTGDMLYVQGEMDNQKYTDSNGIERYKSFIIAAQIKLLPKAKEHTPAPKKQEFNAEFDDSDIPF